MLFARVGWESGWKKNAVFKHTNEFRDWFNTGKKLIMWFLLQSYNKGTKATRYGRTYIYTFIAENKNVSWKPSGVVMGTDNYAQLLIKERKEGRKNEWMKKNVFCSSVKADFKLSVAQAKQNKSVNACESCVSTFSICLKMSTVSHTPTQGRGLGEVDCPLLIRER